MDNRRPRARDPRRHRYQCDACEAHHSDRTIWSVNRQDLPQTVQNTFERGVHQKNLSASRKLAERLQSDPRKGAYLNFAIEEILRRKSQTGTFLRDEDGYRLKYVRTAWPDREKFLYSRNGELLEYGDRVIFTLMVPPQEEIYDYALPSPAEQDVDGFHMDAGEGFDEPLASASSTLNVDSGDDLRPGSAMSRRARMLRANLPRPSPARQPPTSRLFSTPTPSGDSNRFPEQGDLPLLAYDTPSRSDTPPPLPPSSSSAPPPGSSSKRPRNPDLTITLPTQTTSQSPASKRARTSASPAVSNARLNSASSSSKELSADDRETILEAFRQISASNSPARAAPGSPASAHSVLDGGTPRNITIHRTIVVRQSLMSAILTPIKNALFGGPSED
ncbi:hypothetical protein HDU86_000144 [Geranomyces michiganensis]|nr:hypothetical protein HDU86_000144 [Geranomyces michiganensis]